jgi:hypothetical protein
LCAGLAHATGGSGGDDQAGFKTYVPSKWEFILPAEKPIDIGVGPDGNRMIPIPHAGGPGFICAVDGMALAVDTNGDGKVDEKVKGLGGSVLLRAKNAEGKTFSYGVRITKNGTAWQYATGCAMSGKVLGEDVKLIDMTGNGRFDDFGADAMIVGSGKAASYLSKVISVGGKLYEIQVDASGSSVTTTPYAGQTGTLNLMSGFKSEGSLTSAVVINEKGDLSFELSGSRSGSVVPAGEYKLASGSARKGGESVRIRAGNTKPFVVESDKTSTVEWGGPLTLDFEYTVEKDKITVPPTVKFFGRGGEEYYEFKPDATSPKIIVFNAGTKKKVTEGRFGGC